MTTPATGVLEGGVHHFPIRIYYQDTDVSGIVYHANYLNFMERARTEFLRLIGIEQRTLLEDAADRGFFALRDVNLDFLRPARIDDALIVDSWMTALNAASCTIRQRIRREAEILVEGRLRIVMLGEGGRPRRWPAPWRAILQDLSILPD